MDADGGEAPTVVAVGSGRHSKNMSQSGSGACGFIKKEADLVVHKIPREWVLSENSTMSMMNDCEEDLDELPAENKEKLAECMVGAYRAESTDQHTAGSGITTKIPPLSDGSTSWFKYEELIDDWLDLTVLEAEKTRSSTEEQTCRRCRHVQMTTWP